MNARRGIRLREGVRFAVEPGGLLLADVRSGEVVALDPVASVVGELLVEGYDLDGTAALLALVADLEPAAAMRQVRDTVATLRERGFVEPEGDDA